MKQVLLIIILAVCLVSAMGCSGAKKKADIANNSEISVTGKVTAIENGKDGYIATLKTDDNKEYIATISIVNLNRSGGEYQPHSIGDIITVKGSSWKDVANKVYITVRELK